MSEIPVPRGGIEIDWHAACVLLRRRFRKLEKAANAVVKATDETHDNDPWPIKYRAPYGAIVKLRETIAEVGTEYRPSGGDPSAPVDLTAERDRLREALKPFADAGGMLPLTFGPDNEPVGDDEEVSISCVGYPLGEVTAADLSRAYFLLYPTIEGSKP